MPLDEMAELPPGAVSVSRVHPAWAFDPRDDTKLMAAATDVFVGTVVAQVSTVPLPTSAPGVDIPRTQYTVKVSRKLKGRARGTMTVSQLAGIDTDSGCLSPSRGTRCSSQAIRCC